MYGKNTTRRQTFHFLKMEMTGELATIKRNIGFMMRRDQMEVLMTGSGPSIWLLCKPLKLHGKKRRLKFLLDYSIILVGPEPGRRMTTPLCRTCLGKALRQTMRPCSWRRSSGTSPLMASTVPSSTWGMRLGARWGTCWRIRFLLIDSDGFMT